MEQLLITPKLAQEFLDKVHPTKQRNIQTKRVNMYAFEMRNSRWHESNDAICFSKDGWLINGQHRLAAIVESGCSVYLDVKYDMSDDAIAYLDRGQKRNNRQVLRSFDADYGHGDAIRFVCTLTRGVDKNVPESVLIQCSEHYREAQLAIPKSSCKGYTAPVRAALIVAICDYQVSPDIAVRIHRVLSSEIPEQAFDFPIIAFKKLYRRIISIAGNGSSLQISTYHAAERLIHALVNNSTQKSFNLPSKTFLYGPKFKK